MLEVTPKRHPDSPTVGVFASRSPARPNPIGLSVAELVEVRGSVLTFSGLDAMRGSPVIDLKPYLPRADAFPEARVTEWLIRGPKT